MSLWNEAQLAADTTLVSPVRGDGKDYPRAAAENGIRLEAARKRKEDKYPELLNTRRCKLVVTAMKVGDRWSEEAWTFLTLLAETKAKTGPKLLEKSTHYCLLRRWSQMVAVAAQSAFAASLLGEKSRKTPCCNNFLSN